MDQFHVQTWLALIHLAKAVSKPQRSAWLSGLPGWSQGDRRVKGAWWSPPRNCCNRCWSRRNRINIEPTHDLCLIDHLTEFWLPNEIPGNCNELSGGGYKRDPISPSFAAIVMLNIYAYHSDRAAYHFFGFFIRPQFVAHRLIGPVKRRTWMTSKMGFRAWSAGCCSEVSRAGNN